MLQALLLTRFLRPKLPLGRRSLSITPVYHVLTPLSIYLILASLCERALYTLLDIVDVTPVSVTIPFPSLRNLRYLAQVYTVIDRKIFPGSTLSIFLPLFKTQSC